MTPRVGRLLATLLVLVVVVASMVGGAGPVAAQTTAAPVLITISAQVRGTDPFRLELQAPAAVATDTVRIALFARASRAKVREIVEGRSAPERGDYNPVVRRVADVLDATKKTLVLNVPSGELPQTPGVYPMQITVGASRPLTTWLVRVGPPAAGETPFSVSLVVPVRAPLGDRADGTVALDPTEVTRLDAVATVVEGAPGGAITLVPNPETLDALDGSRPDVRAVLEHLRSAAQGDLVLGSTFVPIDIDAWRRAGRDDHVSLQLRWGRDVAARTLGRSSTDISSRTALLAPYDTPSALEALRRDGTANVIVPDTMLEPLRTDAFPSPFSQTFRLRDSSGQDLLAVATDSWLSNAIVDLDRATERAARAQQIIADLAAGFYDRPTLARGSVVLLPADWSPTAAVVDALLKPLATSTVTQFRDVESFLGTVSRSSPEREGQVETLLSGPLRRGLVSARGADIADHAAEVDRARATIESYTAIFGTPPANRVTSFDELLLASSDVHLTADERRTFIDAVTSAVDRGLRTADGRIGITVPESERITLTSRRGTLRVSIENALPTAATVRIDLRSEKLSFPGGASITTTLQPGSNAVEFDVRTKASGDSLIEYTVNAPSGAVGEIAKGKLRVRSYALSGLGVVLSAVAVLVLATWWIRHGIKARRARAATPTPV